MLMPRKVKHRKQHRGRLTGHGQGRHRRSPSATTASRPSSPGWITARQIEAARIAMTRHIKRGGKVWINVFPDKPVTQKPAETRMGSGKGNPEKWVAVVKPGRILFELSYPDPEIAKAAIERAIQKLPIKARFVDPRGGVLMAKDDAVKDLADARAGREAGRGEGRAVQPALPARHRPARQHRPPRPGARSEVARINTELREREIAAAEALAAQEETA